MTVWYTVFCKPRGEATAERNLANQHYSVYLPRLLTQKYRAGKWVDRVEALFPRYLFIKPRDAEQSLSPVSSTVGVACVVRFGTRPAMLPDELIQAMRACEDERIGLRVHRNKFKPGDAIKLVDGPLSGVRGVFGKEAGEERVTILLELLGKINALTVDQRCVVPAASASG